MPAVPFGRLVDEVLALYDTPLRRPATRAKMRQALAEFAAHCRSTRDITPGAIAAWLKAHPDRSPTTADSVLRSFRAACSYAAAQGYLKSSPFAYRKTWVEPDDPEDAGKHHPREAIARVLALLKSEAKSGWENHRLFALAHTVALTGLRRGEALHLLAADCHLAERWIGVPKHRRGYRAKTRASCAPVPCPDELADVLAGWLPLCGSPWAFPGVKSGRPWTGGPPGGKPLDRLKAAGLRAGVAGFTFLSLRHSWATHAESLWGLSELTVQRVLRHTTVRTQRKYRHPDVGNLVAGVRSISFGVGGQGHGQGQEAGAIGA